MMPALMGSDGVDRRREVIMADRHHAKVWAVGALGALVAVGGVAWLTRVGRHGAASTGGAAAKAGPGTLAGGNPQELAALARRVTPKADAPLARYTDAEAAEVFAALGEVRAGFAKFAPEARGLALAVAGQVLARLAVDPAPPAWSKALEPAHGLLTSGLADSVPGVRVAATAEVGRLWSWTPGCTPTPYEERTIDDWKQSFVAPTVRALAAREPETRAAAVACLAKLPINDAAAPAAAYVADPEAIVRQQALIGFASRRDLLSEEAVLPLLHDPNPAVAFLARRTLMARGLNEDQVALGRLIAHPSAARRVSVIPQLLSRTDIDPVVWLVQLSRDADESVRAKALEALATRTTPEARSRLREMAQSDESARIRSAAAKVAPAAAPDSTVALPPLPGSAGLNPRAN